MSYQGNSNANVNANANASPNNSGEKKKSTALSASAQPFPYTGPNNYPAYQAGQAQGARPANPSTGYVSASQPPGPPFGVPHSHFAQQGKDSPANIRSIPLIQVNGYYLALSPAFVPQGSNSQHFSVPGIPNYWSQVPSGSYAPPSQQPQTMPNNTVSPNTPRVVLPPSQGQDRPNSQTPTRPRGDGGRGQGTGLLPPPGLVPSSRQIVTDPRQNMVSSPTFNKYYLPMQARDRQYQGQQTQMEQQQTGQMQMGNPAYNMAPQKPQPQPHPDRHARQRILDEQAKSFSQEDDDAFYPHND
ncbi:hypothetical protein F4774DRAFT_429933 [Daldinia eschscholtzii]|nr:hypothetical protein F4774DRAFT_429933 [Daldinia eschscholtzii]